MPRKSVSKIQDKESENIQSLVGSPETGGEISAVAESAGEVSSGVAMTEVKPNPLVVDDRLIPDAALPTEMVSGVLDIANEGSGLFKTCQICSE